MSLRTRIGVMVPSTNTTFEADFQLVAPPISVHDCLRVVKLIDQGYELARRTQA